MPELPEVESLARYLAEQMTGHTIKKVEVAALNALRTFNPPIDALHGRTVSGTSRRGKFILIHTEAGPTLAIHLARAGWIRWRDDLPSGPAKPGKASGPLALRVRIDDGTRGFDATEAGTEKRLAVHVVNDPDDVEHIATLGIDPLDPAFTADGFKELLQAAGGAQIKGVITDQTVIAGVGNAYSDEALHMARLSPFKPANKLTEAEAEDLRDAIVDVLSDAVERSLGLPASGLKKEKKEKLRVHGRTGLPCPVCGDTVREVSFATKSLQYCATCQTGGKPLADRRLSRLLK